MLTVYYNHDRRTCTKHENGRETEISVEAARDLFVADRVDDYNIAFHRLVCCDFDTDKVEAEYAGMEE